MIEFGGTLYYIDMDALDKCITLNNYDSMSKTTIIEKRIKYDKNGEIIETEHLETTTDKGKEVDSTKYDILRMMIEFLIDYDEETDDSLGADRALAKTQLSYKLAFNTLYNYGILKEKE